jgi:hypothetical protein
MNLLERYLENINEQFSPSIAKSEVSGNFKTEWTDCYDSRCETEGEESKFAKRYCKVQCQLTACNRAIARLNSLKTNCAKALYPNRCVESLNNEVTNYRDKVRKLNDMQDEISARQAAFRRTTGA